MSSPTMVGRDAELEQLEAAWRITLTGESQLILISGEAGIGKTRLANEFAERVRRDGGRVLSGVCVDLRQGGLPYAPIRQAIRALTRTADDRQRIEALRDGLTAVLPDPRVAHGGTVLDEQDRRVRLFESLLHLFQEFAADAPVLLIVDDVHWADQATLDLLTFLARNLTGVPVLALLTFRDEGLPLDDPLKGFLIGQGSGTVRARLTLSRLGERDVAAQIAGIVESRPDPELVETVFQRSDGNPFFVEQLVAGTGDRGGVPPTVRESLLSRIAHLPAETRRLLGLAAVAGRTVDHETLSKVANVHDQELSEILRAAVDARVLEADENGYTYRHTLLREALYDDLLPSERRAMHRTYASVLAASDQREPSIVGAVATHHDLGGEPAHALPAFVEAAAAAERSFAFAEAERYLRRAVELWDQVDDPATVLDIDKVTLLQRSAEAALAVEDTERTVPYARAALELVNRNDDPARTGLLLSLLGRAYWTAGDQKLSHEAYTAALRTVPVDPPSRERVEALAYYGAQLATEGRFTEAKANAEEAIRVARISGAVTYDCRPLLTAGSVTARQGDLQRGLEVIAEAEAIARDHGLAVEIMRVYLHRGRALQAYAAWEAAWRNYLEGAAEAPKFGMVRRYGWRFHVLAARMLFWLGRWDDARELLREAREQWTGRVLAHPLLMIASGQWDAARQWFAEQHSLWRSDGAGLLQQPEAQVELATWLGDYDGALSHCARGLTLVGASEEPLPAARLCVAGLRAHADRSEATSSPPEARPPQAVHLHGRVRALGAAREPRPDGWGKELAALVATGTAELSRLQGGDPTVWEAAADAWSDLSMPYPAAYARFRQGQGMLTTAGDRKRAAPLLQEAYAVARELGARPLMDLIERCVGRGGLAVQGSAGRALDDRSNRYDLTPRERQVLDLLLEGYSNRAIGEALYIAERTASVHVSHILRKLGVGSRAEAVGRVLRDRGQDRSS